MFISSNVPIGWRNFVKVAVIACSDENNNQICRDYEIMGYPTVRYFSPHPAPTDIGIDFFRSYDIQVMKNDLIKKLSGTQNNGNLSTLCDLQPYNKSSLLSDSGYMLTFVIVDTPDSLFAKELIIDYCQNKKIKIIYALNSSIIISQLNIEIYPSLYRVQHDNQFILLASGHNKTSFIENINLVLESSHMSPFNIIDITTKLYNMLFTKGRISTEVNIVYLSDLEATLKYSLEHEIILRSSISDEALVALNTYLELLIEYFPTSTRGKKFIKMIWDNIQYNKTVGGEQFGFVMKKYESLLNPYVTKRKWIGCEGSRPMYRRYPCGLWTLFHTLTVQASTKNSNSFNGTQVLEAIAGYVKHFFGCTDCSEHFMQMATSIKYNVSSLDDAVLWLWSAHNKVNERLAGDVTEDPMHPKVLFPLKSHCTTCYLNDNEWNKTEVLIYLKNMYSTISIKQTPNDNINSEPQNMLLNKHVIDDNNYTILDEDDWNIDINTCMLSYVLSCSVLMILFYLLVVKKRCKKNKYIYFILGKV